MTRDIFTEGDLNRRRQWRVTMDWSRENALVVEITCPRKGCRLDITDDYAVQGNGWVTPTVLCGCGWHGRVVLAGWRDGVTR